MFNGHLPSFFEIFAPWGLILVAAFFLHLLGLKLRSTFLGWVLAILLGFVAAYCVEFFVEIGLLVVLGSEPFYFDNLATHFVAAGAAIWVSASAKPSRWPIFVPCTIIAGLALQHGIRFDEMASTVASAITFAVGIACWVLVPREFQTKPSLSEPVQ